ncbi:ATP-binding protein [Steroidobacter sp.]|uniref:ATP-binding protein n=1 Tax=Steroidobacter sp. TaxID=1978227 RepID=UPI001A4E5A57|nr:AAA family ATPase [Steroidobacter sp.]MBL8265252.1 AAA family ATPase [Steroidobacter sp.]
MSDAIRPVFPFAALVGQPRLQLALTLIAIDPRIGGLLIDGPRGTAKSTSARALAELLPSGAFVTLPLGATEEMLIGSLSVDTALQSGKVTFAPGLLAKAHGGVLYVDEVNLLPDVLVDQLLDVAASGVNFIERDGVSHRHAAGFALIGTMNADEGELRPQLQDRFGLALSLSDCTDPATRVDIVKSRLAFDRDPEEFRNRFAGSQAWLRADIAQARAALPGIVIDDVCIAAVSELCVAAGVEGLRADLVIVRAACAFAARNGDTRVTMEHVSEVAPLALHHRARETTSRESPPTQGPSKPREAPRSQPDDARWGAMAPSPVKALATPAIEPPAQKKSF